MFQIGPGEGYRAAKDRSLGINPHLSCRISYNGGVRHFRIYDSEKDIGCAATSAREAWNKVLCRLVNHKEGL